MKLVCTATTVRAAMARRPSNAGNRGGRATTAGSDSATRTGLGGRLGLEERRQLAAGHALSSFALGDDASRRAYRRLVLDSARRRPGRVSTPWLTR